MTRTTLTALLMIFLVAGAKAKDLRGQEGKSTRDPAGFGIWSLSDFKTHERALDSRVGPDHSARETLGDYGNHRIRFIHRVGTGAPEFHTYYVDLWIVESGRGTLIVGGTLLDPKPLSGNDPETRGDMTGSSIRGGERHEVSTGDVIHIPPKTPHQILVPKGEEITYLRIAIPSE